jgi:hypothetical protein
MNSSSIPKLTTPQIVVTAILGILLGLPCLLWPFAMIANVMGLAAGMEYGARDATFSKVIATGLVMGISTLYPALYIGGILLSIFHMKRKGWIGLAWLGLPTLGLLLIGAGIAIAEFEETYGPRKIPEKSDIQIIEEMEVDRRIKDWPEDWPTHWKVELAKNGTTIDFSNITEQSKKDMYKLYKFKWGLKPLSQYERIKKLGEVTVENGRPNISSVLIPLEDDPETLEVCRKTARKFQNLTGISPEIAKPLGFIIENPNEKIHAYQLLEKSQEHTKSEKTLQFFVTAQRIVIPEDGYNRFAFFAGEKINGRKYTISSFWALRLKEDLSETQQIDVISSRLARNLLAPTAWMLNMNKSSDPNCPSIMQTSAEEMDLQNETPSQDFLQGIQDFENPQPKKNPEGNISTAQVATIMMTETWKRASQGDYLMMATLIDGKSYFPEGVSLSDYPNFQNIDFRIAPKIHEERGKETDFIAQTKNGEKVVVTYNANNPHRISTK